MAEIQEEIRIPEDSHRPEEPVRRDGQPQEGAETEEGKGRLCGALRPREALQLVPRDGRQGRAQHPEAGLPCRCLPPEGGNGRDREEVLLRQGLLLAGHRLLQRPDPGLQPVHEPEQEEGKGQALRPVREISRYGRQDPPFGPGLAVPEAGLPVVAQEARHRPVQVEKRELPGQREDGEPVLEAEEGDVLRTRKGLPQLCGSLEGDRRVRAMV